MAVATSAAAQTTDRNFDFTGRIEREGIARNHPEIDDFAGVAVAARGVVRFMLFI